MISLKEINGARELEGYSEAGLTRATIKRGDWVRCRNPGDHRYRKRVVSATPERLHFDWTETKDRTFEPCFSSAATCFWVPGATPEKFETEDSELRAEVHELRIRLKETLRGKERAKISFQCARSEIEDLFGENNKLKRTVISQEADITALKNEVERFQCEEDEERNAKCNVISERNKDLAEQTRRLDMTVAALGEAERDLMKAKSDIEFMRGLLKHTKKEATDALCAHKGALGQRDKERAGRWRALEQIRELEAEILKLRRQHDDSNTGIVM
jgi:hypothetical protein